MPQARAASPVIHFDSPLAVAIFPSSVMAAFTVTNGVRWTIQWLNASFSRAHSLASFWWGEGPREPGRGSSVASPHRITAMPARRKILKARPACFGFGSTAPTITRLIPAAMMASVQGGVRPRVQQGSSVTKSVEPRGL